MAASGDRLPDSLWWWGSAAQTDCLTHFALAHYYAVVVPRYVEAVEALQWSSRAAASESGHVSGFRLTE